MFKVPEKRRVKEGPMATTLLDGNNGVFEIDLPAARVLVSASDGMGWEHVSASTRTRTLTWDEMCMIKNLFWDPEDAVVQFHPPKSEYVNRHPFCLHLWRPKFQEIPRPPRELVG